MSKEHLYPAPGTEIIPTNELPTHPNKMDCDFDYTLFNGIRIRINKPAGMSELELFRLCAHAMINEAGDRRLAANG